MLKSLLSAVVLFFVTSTVRAQSLQLYPIKDYVTYDSASNTLTAVFGYLNKEGTYLNVPFGSNNIFLPAPFFRGQPTAFFPGIYHNVFSVTFPANSYVDWTLAETVVHASMEDVSAIQYQGRLTVGGTATNGLMEFQFHLFDAASAGNQVMGTLTYAGASALSVSNGLFNVNLPWGYTAFTNTARWLEIQVRAPGESNYVTLSPRQALMPAPFAANSQYLGGIKSDAYARLDLPNTFASSITASAFIGDGSQLSGTFSDARLSSNVALLGSAQTFTGAKTFSAAMKLGPVIARGSFPGRLEIEQGSVNEPALRLSSSSAGHGSGLWLENRSTSTNTWAIYCASNGTFSIGKQETQQAALLINPANMNVTVVSLSQTSDRNAKENFGAIDPIQVLDKVVGLDIKRWNFKGDTNTEHIGPMAQDFYAAFGTGTDERHIATVDADGVALAAIQGLNKKLSAKESEIETLRRENKELAGRLQRVEELLKTR